MRPQDIISDMPLPKEIPTPAANQQAKTKTILIHACCAPCSAAIIEKLKNDGYACKIIFYNPNIHPIEEYNLRRKEQESVALKMGVAFIALEYDPERWLTLTRGLENEPERGRRCEKCFMLRLERTARYAHENNFSIFTSTLGISRWKDMEQVNNCGINAAAVYPGLEYWTYNWRKKGGSQRMDQIAKEQNLYRQNYCGCVYSRAKKPICEC